MDGELSSNSLESEAATSIEARSVLADSLESEGNEALARWWRSELLLENGSGSGSGYGNSSGRGSGYGDGDGSGYGRGNGFGYGRGSGYGYGDGFGSGFGYAS